MHYLRSVHSANYVNKVPPSMAKAQGGKAAGSPVLSIALACSKKGSLSSYGDETSRNMTPLGGGIGSKPTDITLLASTSTGKIKFVRERQQQMIGCLTRKVKEMVLDNDPI